MEITVKRICLPDYTIGHLSIDNNSFKCDTLEDPNRDLNKNGVFDNGEVKINGNTAIPFGRYQILMNVVSPKFSKYPQYAFCEGKLPRLMNVPNFQGVLIHIGNTVADTEGCILVGYNKVKGKVINSTIAFRELYKIMKESFDKGEEIWITFI